jgi:cytoskeletal protein CcmA (bactofilin family)
MFFSKFYLRQRRVKEMKAFKADGEDSGQGRISRGVEISGDVIFADALQVDGKVIGKVVSESGTLAIEQTGDVQADVDVGVCVIRGAVRGNVSAKSRVEIYRTARVEGDINTPVLLVEEGAQLSGAIRMGQTGKTGNESARPGEALRADAAEQLRKTQGAS